MMKTSPAAVATQACLPSCMSASSDLPANEKYLDGTTAPRSDSDPTMPGATIQNVRVRA